MSYTTINIEEDQKRELKQLKGPHLNVSAYIRDLVDEHIEDLREREA